MRPNFAHRIAAYLLFSGALVLCEPVSPARADWLPNLLSSEDEAQMGAKAAPEMTKQFGGAYDDLGLANYVTSLGQLLASASNDPGIQYRFTVLDSPIVNAFALPGGYVFVTRGLLGLADNEAELAGVLAHEIGHVTAHHSAQRYSQTVFAQLGLGILGAVTGSPLVGQLGGSVAQVAIMSYSRDQEFEADTLGVRTMSRVGFDPHAMSWFLAKLQAHDQLEATIAGHPGAADKFSLLATHPRTADRVERAIEEAGTASVRDPMVGAEIYLRKIDGIIYGDNPSQGLIRGQTFIHPRLRFQFEVPEGFRLVNGTDEVVALGNNGAQGAQIQFDITARKGNYRMADYLTSVWAKNVRLRQVETVDINGMEAATGSVSKRTENGAVDLRLVAIAFDNGGTARFLFVTPANLTAPLAGGLKTTTYSFRRLSGDEAAHIAPDRIRVVQTGAHDTIQSLSSSQPFKNYQEQRFRVLNGLAPDAALAPGVLVKLVTE
jgi:predicted Zn-dependent protease